LIFLESCEFSLSELTIVYEDKSQPCIRDCVAQGIIDLERLSAEQMIAEFFTNKLFSFKKHAPSAGSSNRFADLSDI
jgi:hypothetical protein